MFCMFRWYSGIRLLFDASWQRITFPEYTIFPSQLFCNILEQIINKKPLVQFQFPERLYQGEKVVTRHE